MRNHIYITRADFERLRPLIEGRRAGGSFDLEYLDLLEQELDRAEIVEPDEVPHDTVTMNSEVRLKDLDTGQEKVYCLVFPEQVRTENGVSILAPIGTAILGYRVGDVIEWRVPKGIRRLQVIEVIYQPEAAAAVSV
ncbi:MAG: nucleoside diphosphate kinase regulator [Bryobacterales bacterium]|nr:nucleoside diphosphate kinase regulator [Bryobacterales bacterium]